MCLWELTVVTDRGTIRSPDGGQSQAFSGRGVSEGQPIATKE